jgi:hypothetical protein
MADNDTPQRVEHPTTPAPTRLKLNAEGRLMPRTDEERAADAIRIRAALARMAEIPDDPPGSDEEFWRAIDSHRPDRPLFEGMY